MIMRQLYKAEYDISLSYYKTFSKFCIKIFEKYVTTLSD